MKGILVTGGAGFIGSHICLNLLKKGYKLFVIDSFINSSIQALNRVTFLYNKLGIDSNNDIKIYSGDVRDINILNKIFEDSISLNCRIIAVIHLAGLKSVPESIHNPIDYWDVNVNGSINLIKAMQIYKCYTFVFSSSASIYSSLDSYPYKETSKIEPTNPYSTTKYIVERFLNNIYMSEKNKWKIACLRYFNPIGAHESGMIGESPKGIPGNLFPCLINVALGFEKELKIFGNDWPTHDGTCIRDYLHVIDLAEAHFRALDYLFTNKPQILNLNIGTGKGTSVLELIKVFQKVNKMDLNFSYFSRRDGDIPVSISDTSLSKKILKWMPSKTIEDMVRDGFNWSKNNPKGY